MTNSDIRLDWDWATATGGNLSRAEHRYSVGVILRDLPSAAGWARPTPPGSRNTRSSASREPLGWASLLVRTAP